MDVAPAAIFPTSLYFTCSLSEVSKEKSHHEIMEELNL